MAANLHVVIYRLHSALSKREAKIKKSGRIFCAFDKFSKFTFEILPTNLVVCKAAFCTFQLYITSEVNSTMRHCFFISFSSNTISAHWLTPTPEYQCYFFEESCHCYRRYNSYQRNHVMIRNFYFLVKKLVVYYQCCVLIGWATTRLYVIAH